MVRVEHDYRFEGSDGPRSLPELSDGRSQLVLYRFFFEAEAQLTMVGLDPGQPVTRVGRRCGHGYDVPARSCLAGRLHRR